MQASSWARFGAARLNIGKKRQRLCDPSGKAPGKTIKWMVFEGGWGVDDGSRPTMNLNFWWLTPTHFWWTLRWLFGSSHYLKIAPFITAQNHPARRFLRLPDPVNRRSGERSAREGHGAAVWHVGARSSFSIVSPRPDFLVKQTCARQRQGSEKVRPTLPLICACVEVGSNGCLETQIVACAVAGCARQPWDNRPSHGTLWPYHSLTVLFAVNMCRQRLWPHDFLFACHVCARATHLHSLLLLCVFKAQLQGSDGFAPGAGWVRWPPPSRQGKNRPSTALFQKGSL